MKYIIIILISMFLISCSAVRSNNVQKEKQKESYNIILQNPSHEGNVPVHELVHSGRLK